MDAPQNPEKFTPTGAMAFFAVLIVLSLIIYFGIYYIMIARS